MKYCCDKLSMIFSLVMKPFHIKRGVCILEAKIIDPQFGERYAFKRKDGTIVKRSEKELRLTVTHCPYCGTPLKSLFRDFDENKGNRI
jgi:hypothetical protein